MSRLRGPFAFAALYLGWAYLWWTPLLVSQAPVWQPPNVLFFLIGGASALLAALLLSALEGGRRQLLDLACRLMDVRRIRLRWWLAILLFWPVFDLAVAGAALVLGLSQAPLAPDLAALADPRALAFTLMLALPFPAVEELGLRGYYLERLLERLPALHAGLLNGLTWALWHAPFVCFAGYYDHTTFQPALWWWLPSIVLETLLITRIYLETRRSILAVLLFHAGMNLTGEVLGIAGAVYPLMVPALFVLAVLFGPSRRRLPPA